MEEKKGSDVLREKEVYLVRIIRRGGEEKESLVGTVEDIRGRRKGRFKTGEELLSWLMSQKDLNIK